MDNDLKLLMKADLKKIFVILPIVLIFKDGISVEWYKLFWIEIKELYYSYATGSLTKLQTQSIITQIPEQDKDPSNITNWRPIFLFNIDFKIAAKVIANILKKGSE